MITVFDSIKSTDAPKKQEVDVILNLIKTGGTLKDLILDIRGLYSVDKSKYKAQKVLLPIILFNGVFNKRNKEGLVNSSGYAVIDFDGVELASLEKKLRNDPYIYSFFLSPSGDGYKALMKIPIVNDDEDFKEIFAAIEKRYPELDKSGKDISRACFFSFDPDIYVNKKAITFQERVKAEKRTTNINAKSVYTDYSKVNIALNKIRQSVEGEQHNVLLKMSILMGGYVAARKVDENEAIRLLEQEFERKNPDAHYDYKKTIRDGLKEGKGRPIRDIEQLEEYKVGKGKCYFSLFDVRNDFNEIYKNGYKSGEHIGWKAARDKMSIKLGATTYVYALPASGKTQFWHEVLVNLSKFKGWKHCLFTPETGNAAEVFVELASIYIGKSFVGDFKMSEEEKEKAINFIETHFLVIDPKDKELDVNDIFDQVDAAEREYDVKIHTITIDPWNELFADFSPFGGREDKYLEYILGRLRKNAVARDRHNCVINHVRDQPMIKDGDEFYYPVPSPNDNSGGRVWWRKGLQMVVTYRPLYVSHNPMKDSDGEPYKKNETHVIIQKSKPKGVGKIGMFKLFYDFKRNQYYEEDTLGMKHYSRALDEETPKENKTEPNEDFNNEAVPF